MKSIKNLKDSERKIGSIYKNVSLPLLRKGNNSVFSKELSKVTLDLPVKTKRNFKFNDLQIWKKELNRIQLEETSVIKALKVINIKYQEIKSRNAVKNTKNFSIVDEKQKDIEKSLTRIDNLLKKRRQKSQSNVHKYFSKITNKKLNL